MIFFATSAVVLLLGFCEVDIVKCVQDDLKTWVRNPKFDKRSNAREESEISDSSNSEDAMIARSTHFGRRYDKSAIRVGSTKTIKTQEESGFDAKISPYSIARHLKHLTRKFPKANITQEILAQTDSYNDIVLLKVTERKRKSGYVLRAKEVKYATETEAKKIIFIVHGLSVMGMNSLPCLTSEDQFVELLRYYFAHLDKFNIFLIPMANPDGLRVSPNIWNKNTSPQGACSGVALDRNFDIAWNDTKTISPCSQQYPGPYPFSEPETRAIRSVLHRYSNKLIAYLHVHAGTYDTAVFKGDAVLYPKGYTEVTSDDKYVDLKGEVDEAMKNASFKLLSVTVDTLHSWYGKVSGSSVDYVSKVYGIPYAMELVMQLYTSDPAKMDPFDMDKKSEEANVALRHMWKPLIDVIFNSIHKSQHNNEVR